MSKIVEDLHPEVVDLIIKASKEEGGNRIGQVTATLLAAGKEDSYISWQLVEFACQVVIGSLACRARTVPPEPGTDFFATETWVRYAKWASLGLTGRADVQSAALTTREAGQ